MAGAKGKANTGSVFLTQKTGKFGSYYEGEFPGVGVVKAEINGDSDLVVKSEKATELVKPKSNDFGSYYIAQVGDTRYFMSERENSRGPYMLAKVAPERAASADGRPARPASYGGRK